LGEQAADAGGFEDGLGVLDAHASGRETQVDAAGVARVAGAKDVAAAMEVVDGNGHGGGSDSHVSGEVHEGSGFEVVEVVEDAGLMSTEHLARFGVADMASVAGEEDAGVKV